MEDFSKVRHRQGLELLRLCATVAGTVALAFLIIVSARAAWDMYGKFSAASESRQAAESELQALQEKKERVEAAVVSLSSERGVEAEVRERFGVAKPGEGEIKIVRDESQDAPDVSKSKNIFQRIWEALFVW